MRLIASQLPFSAPWRSMASEAYAEQLGVNLQALPNTGLMVSW